MKTHRLLATAAALALSHSIQAAIVYTQNFESLTGGAINNAASANDLQGQGGTNTFTAPTRTDVLSPGGLGYTNGSLTINGGSKSGYSTQRTTTDTASYLFSNAFSAQTGDVYFSIVWSWTGSDATTDTFAFLVSGQSSLPATADLQSAAGFRISNNGVANSTNANFVNIHARNAGNTSQTVTATGPAANSQGTANFLVGRISKSGGNGGAYDQVSIWVNPNSTTQGTPSLSVTQTISATSLDKFYMWSAANANTNQVFNFDNIVIGTTYADVVGAAPIPEASSFAALAGLAGIGFAATRRRRR